MNTRSEKSLANRMNHHIVRAQECLVAACTIAANQPDRALYDRLCSALTVLDDHHVVPRRRAYLHEMKINRSDGDDDQSRERSHVRSRDKAKVKPERADEEVRRNARPVRGDQL